MSLPNDQRTVQDSQGNEIPFADIEVRDIAGGLVTIYSDADGTTEITQPGFQSDENGFYRFYAQPGYYEITVTGPEGARVLARVNLERGVTSLPDITSLSSLNTAALVDGQQFDRREWWPGTGVGGSKEVWDPNMPVSMHNGGTIKDPAKISELDTVNKTFGTYFTPDTLSGNTGCFVAIVEGRIPASIFGVVDSVADSSVALKAMWSAADGSPTTIDTSVSVTNKTDLNNVDVDCYVPDEVSIDCTGIASGTSLGQQYFLKSSGSIADSSLVTADVQPYSEIRTLSNQDSSVVVSDGTKFGAGDLTILRSDQLFDDAWTGASSSKRGEMLRVKSVSGNEVFFHDKIRFSYLSAQNCVLEKAAPVSFRWEGGKAFGGGVGSAHSFLILDIAESVSINSECSDFEDIGYQLKRTYESSGAVRPNGCTSPGGSVGNSGYGIAFYDATRYADFEVVGLLCRHLVSGGGALPAIDIKARGFAVDCGIDTEAIDCHEPCFDWELDFITRGGQGGAVIRGSDVKINLDVRDSSAGLRIRTFGTVSSQRNIHFNLKVFGSRGAPLTIQGEDSPIRNVTFGTVDIENTRLDGFSIWGDVDNVSGDQVRIKETWLRDGEASSSGRGLFINGEVYSVGERVKNVTIGRLETRDTLNWGLNAVWCEGLRIGDIDIDGSGGADGARVEDSSGVKIFGGKISHLTNLYPLRTDRVDNAAVSCELIADPALTGSVGWRGVDTTNASLRDSDRIVSDSNGALFSGASENLIIIGNNATEVVAGVKFGLGAAANTVVANNLE